MDEIKFNTKLTLAIGLTMISIGVSLWSTIGVNDLTKLPTNYSLFLELTGSDQIISSVNGTLSEPFITHETNLLKVKNVDGNTLEIESHVIGVNTKDDKIIFDAKDVYFVDRTTRQHTKNLDGYFAFPPHVQKQNYELFYPMVIGPATFIFEGEEKINDLQVYVFSCVTTKNDISYAFKQFEPAKIWYDGKCKAWIEPTTGKIVNFELEWDDYFVENGMRKNLVEKGSKHVTDETRFVLTQRAIDSKNIYFFYEVIIPIIFGIIGSAILFTVIIFQKITKQKKLISRTQSSLEQQLLQIKRLQHVLDNSSIVAITDKDGTITYANKKFCDISKYSQEEIIGQNHRILKSGFHDDTFYQNIWDTISSGNVWHGDIKNKAKDGTFYWVRSTITPFLGKDGKPEQYIAVRTDITELYAQKDMIQLQFQELKKIDVQKDEFVTMISHELKTPLVPIMGYSELLKDPHISKNMTSEQLECVNEIYTNAERLESLISDMFDTQKLSLGAMKFNKKMLNLREFFTKIIHHSASLLIKKQIRLDVSSTDITIDTDENRLHQVFDNLIRNAVDFVPNGGIISIGAKPQKDDVLFFVKDNGIGIPKDKQDNLFKKFYQVDTSVTRKHGGTGLGLVICKGIVENMGGKIWVESEEGKGTTFYFTIPKVV